jgi:hypothetical protein
VSTDPKPDAPAITDWRTPQFWTHALAQLITGCVLFGCFTLAEGEQLKGVLEKTLAAAAVIGAQVAVVVGLIRSRRQGGPPAPPAPGPVTPAPSGVLDRSRYTGSLVLVALLAFAAAAPAEESSFTPAVKTSAKPTCRIGRSKAEIALEKQLAETNAKLDRIIAQLEAERRYAPPIIMIPPGGAPRIEIAPGGPPRIEVPPGGPPILTPPPGGPPPVTPPPGGAPKLDLAPGGPPRTSPAAPPATGFMRYTLYRRGAR